MALIAVPLWIGLSVWTRTLALANLHDEAVRTVRQESRLFASELARFRLLPLVLGEYTDLAEALGQRDAVARRRMDAKLELLAERTGAPVIYLIDAAGNTVSASNARTSESFVDRNYRFRPYFVQAMRDGAAEYYAVGNVSGRPGLFLARRLGNAARPLGVVVVKVEFDAMTRAWSSDPGETLALDSRGIILFATDPAERFRATRPIGAPERSAISVSGQFGNGELPVSRYRLTSDDQAIGPAGERLIFAGIAMPVAGWKLIHLVPAAPALRASADLARLYAFTAMLLLIALTALIGWRMTRATRIAADRSALEGAVVERTEALRNEIAERVAADRRFRDAREELAQANRLGSLGSITAGLAHEINQPVATIRTLAENARHHLAAGRLNKVDWSLSNTIDLTARIGAITQEMRRFARRSSGMVGPVPLDLVIEGTRLLIGDRFRAAGVAMTWPAPGQPTVIAGRVRLEQVLVNLLQNALDAVIHSREPEVVLSVARDGEQVTLTVTDTGPGIDPALGDTIFDPFVTGKADGLGLGLGIVRDIVGQFGASVSAGDAPFGGAMFRVTLKGV